MEEPNHCRNLIASILLTGSYGIIKLAGITLPPSHHDEVRAKYSEAITRRA